MHDWVCSCYVSLENTPQGGMKRARSATQATWADSLTSLSLLHLIHRIAMMTMSTPQGCVLCCAYRKYTHLFLESFNMC